MQTDIIKQIIHLPIADRVEIIEKISRSVREELSEKKAEKSSYTERQAAYLRLRGIASAEGKTPPTDEEVEKDYINHLSEKYK